MRDSPPDLRLEARGAGLLQHMRRRQCEAPIAAAARRHADEAASTTRFRPRGGAFNQKAATLLIKWKDV